MNHVAFSKASSSQAMADCVVVSMEMLVAWRKIRNPSASVHKVPRIRVMVWLGFVRS